mgnify:CR=1 FL=1|jgi:hypothetical protein|tara:strand:- start:12234 stop:12575 length:342 start_codon:yes stop_codon:yes gene_type:complete
MTYEEYEDVLTAEKLVVAKCKDELLKAGCPILTRKRADRLDTRKAIHDGTCFLISLEGLSADAAKKIPAYNDMVVWGSYYDDMYMSQTLIRIAEKHDCYIEWMNPGCLSVWAL